MVDMGMAWDTPGTDGNVFANTTSPDYRSFWLRTRTRQPLSNFLGFPLDKDVPRYTGILPSVDVDEMYIAVHGESRAGAGAGVRDGRQIGLSSRVGPGRAERRRRSWVTMITVPM
jgi:cholesterol oxidase